MCANSQFLQEENICDGYELLNKNNQDQIVAEWRTVFYEKLKEYSRGN